MSILIQKFVIFSSILTINFILSILFISYEKYWYAFIPILGLSPFISSINVFLLWGKKMLYGKDNNQIFRKEKTSFAYVIPTYNESYEELKDTLDSLSNQILSYNDDKIMLIVCDGKIKGKGNNKSTDEILVQELLSENISAKTSFRNAYMTWDNKYNHLDVYDGYYNDVPYILLIKEHNYGKRDGLVLIRRLLFQYNENVSIHSFINEEFMSYFYSYLNYYYNGYIDYLIGTDADTVFERNCTDELIKKIEQNPNNVGCVGFVNISNKCSKFSPFTLYQYPEYIYAQCLKRQQQSEITHKVNCLSGCVQILKICAETCGDKILSKFNHKPIEDANILDHIRSYASEDRNHVCLMLSEYPNVYTVQSLYANAYTKIPMSFEVLFSQRRRWSLGAITNDILLLTKSGILLYERLSALASIITFTISPFILVATAVFIRSIILSPTMLMLYLSVVILIPLLYSVTIPLFIKQMSFRDGLYYILSYAFYIITNLVMNILIYSYAILNMDKLSWGKTRQIVKKEKEFIDKYTQTKNDLYGIYVINDNNSNETYTEESDDSGKVSDDSGKVSDDSGKVSDDSEKGTNGSGKVSDELSYDMTFDNFTNSNLEQAQQLKHTLILIDGKNIYSERETDI